MIQLHGFCQSGNSFKVAFALRALKLPYQDVLVDFFNGQTRQADWRAGTNAMGEAPVLDIDGQRLTQSGAILTYLAEREGRFGGQDASQRLEVLRWLLFDNHKFSSHLATYRFLKCFAPQAPDPAVMAFLRGRVDAAYNVVEKHLATQPFIAGQALTIADFSLCGYLFYPAEELGFDIATTYPAINAWLDRLRQVDGWGDPYQVLPGPRLALRA